MDTGSPISIMPKDKMREVFPVEKLNLPKDKRFVNINKNPMKMSSRFQVTATFKKIKEKTVWWEAEETEVPFLDMDNFKKLQLRQRKKQLDNNKRKLNHAKICFTDSDKGDQEEQLSQKLAKKFKKLF